MEHVYSEGVSLSLGTYGYMDKHHFCHYTVCDAIYMYSMI